MRIESELVPIRSAFKEVDQLIRRLNAPPETIEVLRERLFGGPDALDELVTTRSEITGAVGAQRMRIFFEPSAVLLRLVAALRTGQFEFLMFECHALSPAVEC